MLEGCGITSASFAVRHESIARVTGTVVAGDCVHTVVFTLVVPNVFTFIHNWNTERPIN